MQNRTWFDPQSEEVIRQGLLRAKAEARQTQDSDLDVAIDYLNGEQLDDTRNQLTNRYGATQVGGGAGQAIEPVAIPLVQRYVDEAASAYSKPVERHLVDEQGKESDATKEETKKLNDHLDAIGFNDTMHAAERVLVLVGRIGNWWQAKRGKLRPVVVYPQWIYPWAPPDEAFSDPSDQEDYAGQIISMCADASDAGSANKKKYACVMPGEVAYYPGVDAYHPSVFDSIIPNPFKWPQILDTPDQRGTKPLDLPLQMVTILSGSKPVGQLMSGQDADLAILNREINVQLSVLLDTMRVQGWSSLILNTLNPNSAPSIRSYGSRFALQMEVGESASYINAANPYTQLVDVLQKVVALSAIAHRQSPNDFSLTGATAASGFAKLVDSLPKIEARAEHTELLRRAEQTLFWPRMCSILTYLGVLSESAKCMKLVTRFADLKYPLAQAEQAAKDQFDIDKGLTTPAQILAERTGMSVEDAEAKIKENLEKAKEQRQEEPQQPQQNGLLSGIIRQRSKAQVGKQNE